MTTDPRPPVAMLCAVAPDMVAALSHDYELIPHGALPDLSPTRRAGITRALTMAMGGAPEALIELLPNLKRIASVGAGLDLFDEDALDRRGIALLPTPHVMTTDTADLAVALVFAVMRNVVVNDRHVRSGAWADARAGLGARVSGKRAGIVGLGRIGRAVAERLSGLGLAVSYTGRSPKPDVDWPFVADVTGLAATVDILCLTCSGGAETRGLVDAGVLRALGPTGFLINVSRGSVVDEAALLDALESGAIAGAGLDVFEGEPRIDPRFAALDTAVLSPHSAVYTRENRIDLAAELGRLLAD